LDHSLQYPSVNNHLFSKAAVFTCTSISTSPTLGEMAVSARSSFCMENNVIYEEKEDDSRAKEVDKVSMES
jgi:hypothetical protein